MKVGYSHIASQPLAPSSVKYSDLASLPLAPVSASCIDLDKLKALAAGQDDMLACTLDLLTHAPAFEAQLTGDPAELLGRFPASRPSATIDGLVDASVLAPCARGQARAPCTVFPVVKKDGVSTRGVVDPQINSIWDNSSTPARLPFLLTRLSDLGRTAKPFTHGCTLDMRSAFYQFSLHPDVAAYFAMRLKRGPHYLHSRLPMGFRPAVHFCQSSLLVLGAEAVNRLCNTRGFDPDSFFVDGWVDNLVIAGTSEYHCEVLLQEILRVAEEIGMNITPEQPIATSITWCGLLIDLSRGTYSLKSDWLKPVRELTLDLVSGECESINPLLFEQLRGKLVYATYIQNFPMVRLSPVLHVSDLDTDVCIAPDIRACLSSVLETILLPGTTRPMCPPTMVIPHVMFTDASSTGLGAVLVSNSRRRVLSSPIVGRLADEHISYKELYAVLWSLNQWPHLCNGSLKCFIDNQSVVAIVNSRHTSSSKLTNPLQRLLSLCESRNLHLLAEYIPTDLNPADEPSRAW